MDQKPKPGERPLNLNGSTSSTNGFTSSTNGFTSSTNGKASHLPLQPAAKLGEALTSQPLQGLAAKHYQAIKAMSPMKKDHYLPSSKFDDLDDYESDPCYKAFAKEMREDLAPTGALENFLAERVILTAWRLKLAQEDLGVEPDDSDKKLERIESRAERAMYKALAVLEKARSPKQRRWGKAAPDAAGTTSRTRAGSSRDETKTAAGTAKDDRPTASASDTWVSGKAKSPQTAPDGTPASTLPPAWRDRLVNDPTVSQESPVVKGTKLTVRQVVSLIVDGQSWDQILKDHPELSEDDVRACLAYAVEEENGSFKVE